MSIFQYVAEHLDEDGCYTPTTLPDEENATISRALGSSDSAVYTMNMPANMEDASKLSKLLQLYSDEPLQPHREEIYHTVKTMCMAEYCDPLISVLDQEDINDVIYALARRFFYNAKDREPVKLAYVLLGVYGMQRIHNEDEEFWRDLVTMAHCEEFTFAFLYSCRIANFQPQKEIWELIGCTKGWGKIFAIIDCKCKDDAHRLWLLKHGIELDTEYPPISVKLLAETHLEAFLTSEHQSEIYKNAITIFNQYLLMLVEYPAEEIFTNFNLAPIHLHNLATKLLQLAKTEIQKIEDRLDILTMSISLRRLAEQQNMTQIDINQCQVLIAECDKIIYTADLATEVENNIFSEGQVNYAVCELAFETDIDIWPQLYAYWQEHLLETELLPILLSAADETRRQRIINDIERQLNVFDCKEDALLTPLHYLQDHPGYGERIICHALTGLYDWPRGAACAILESWDKKYINSNIRQALLIAHNLSHNELVTAHIESLLQDKKFSLKKFLQKEA